MIRTDVQHIHPSCSSDRFTILSLHRTNSLHPSWDGNRVLFEITGGEKRIPCAISRAALEELSEQRHAGGAALVRCFLAARERIEALARDKLRAMLGGVVGTLNIWASDLGDPSPSGASGEAHKPVQRMSA